MVRVVRCDNRDCDQAGVARTIRDRHIGVGVITRDAPYCAACGHEMPQVAPAVAPSKAKRVRTG